MAFQFYGDPSKPALLLYKQLRLSTLRWVNWLKKSSLWCKFFTHLAFLFRLPSQFMLTTWEASSCRRMPAAIKGRVTLMWSTASLLTLLLKASLMWCSQTWQITRRMDLVRMWAKKSMSVTHPSSWLTNQLWIEQSESMGDVGGCFMTVQFNIGQALSARVKHN